MPMFVFILLNRLSYDQMADIFTGHLRGRFKNVLAVVKEIIQRATNIAIVNSIGNVLGSSFS